MEFGVGYQLDFHDLIDTFLLFILNKVDNMVTITMINAPLMEDRDRSVVGSLMVFMLVFGLLSGAALSFL